MHTKISIEIMDKVQYLDLDGLKKYDELVKKYIASVNDALSGNIDSSLKGYVNEKVDEIKERISDLDTIRSNAEKGASALQEEDLGFVTDGDIDGIFK
jgi:hypothetical protein